MGRSLATRQPTPGPDPKRCSRCRKVCSLVEFQKNNHELATCRACRQYQNNRPPRAERRPQASTTRRSAKNPPPPGSERCSRCRCFVLPDNFIENGIKYACCKRCRDSMDGLRQRKRAERITNNAVNDDDDDDDDEAPAPSSPAATATSEDTETSGDTIVASEDNNAELICCTRCNYMRPENDFTRDDGTKQFNQCIQCRMRAREAARARRAAVRSSTTKA